MALSENLQYIRARHNLTQEQLAEQLDVTRQSVSKWESSLSFPEMDTLLKLCDLYDVNLDTLLRGSLEQSQVSDTARYDQFRNRFTWRVSLSVFGILMGVVLSLLCEARGLPEEICGAVLLLIITVATVVLVASGVGLWGKGPAAAPVFLRRRAEAKCPSPSDGAAWLADQGWEVDPEPTGQMEVVVPARFDQIYESYNDIQKAQGFDISRYKGETVTKYTYLVKNYPQEQDGVAANLLVYQGRIIGADLCSLELGGFLKGAKAK